MHIAALAASKLDKAILVKYCMQIIDAGANIFLADKNDQTCLHFACIRHNANLVEKL